MKTSIFTKNLFEDIYQEAAFRFGFELRNIEEIKKGWLNLKWRIETNAGTFLLKQYNKDRLKKYSTKELDHVFLQQNHLHHLGFPCPKILSSNGDIFFQSRGGELFIVMEYCPGENIKPGKLSEKQMYELGYYTGKMHSILNDGRLPVMDKPEFVPPSRSERVAYWKNVHKEIHDTGKFELLPIIEKQLELMEIVAIDNLQVNRVGWAHRDLWVDNLLFEGNHLSAIIDFDRMKYDHLSLDVARAIISGALDGNGLGINNALAFLEGYNVFQETGARFLTDSITLLWYMESVWWLDSQMDKRKGPPVRFVEEMIWLSENLIELEEILGGK